VDGVVRSLRLNGDVGLALYRDSPFAVQNAPQLRNVSAYGRMGVEPYAKGGLGDPFRFNRLKCLLSDGGGERLRSILSPQSTSRSEIELALGSLLFSAGKKRQVPSPTPSSRE
jgi:hypothetical protein